MYSTTIYYIELQTDAVYPGWDTVMLLQYADTAVSS